MITSFIRYFVAYIFHDKTRQRLLILALIGIVISSLALLTIQSIMGGLQAGLIKRSQSVNGSAELIFDKSLRNDEKEAIWDRLQALNITAIKEYEVELLLKNENYFSPAVIHGLDTSGSYLPSFLQNKDLSGLVVGADLGAKLKGNFVSNIEIISPAHTDSLFGEIPGQVVESISDFILVDIAEVDMFHAWVRLSLIQNLVREKTFNKIRIFDFRENLISLLHQNFQGQAIRIISWQEKNKSLVYALNLETFMMLILFSMMSLLVGITIASGFNIFFSKVKIDLMSFWILGCAENRLYKIFAIFVSFMGGGATILGIFLGLGFLMALHFYTPHIMPDVFVERSLPVNITPKGLAISLFIPLAISVTSSLYSLWQMKKESTSFINLIKKVG